MHAMHYKISFNGTCLMIFYATCSSGVAVGIYTTNSPEACFYCADHSQANIIVVEDEKQLEKILLIRSRLPQLKAIIQYSGEPKDPTVLGVSISFIQRVPIKINNFFHIYHIYS